MAGSSGGSGAEPDLARLIVRHRHVAPMLSALLTGTNAGVRIRDTADTVVLEREGGGIGFERFPISVEGRTVGWVEGDRTGRAIAAVLSYAVARESDKRSLAREALDRYRELSLVYELADRLSGELDLDAIGRIAVEHASRLPAGGSGFLAIGDRVVGEASLGSLSPGAGVLGRVVASGIAEEVNDVPGDAAATDEERAFAALIAAPVVARGESLGVLGAASREPVTYQAADLKLLAAIAAIVGPAVAVARAHAASGVPVG
jgi:hypothetical protein